MVGHLKEELMARVDGSFEDSVAWRVIWAQDADERDNFFEDMVVSRQINVDRECVLSLSMSAWFRSNILICSFHALDNILISQRSLRERGQRCFHLKLERRSTVMVGLARSSAGASAKKKTIARMNACPRDLLAS
jgi:hypothetical protein